MDTASRDATSIAHQVATIDARHTREAIEGENPAPVNTGADAADTATPIPTMPDGSPSLQESKQEYQGLAKAVLTAILTVRMSQLSINEGSGLDRAAQNLRETANLLRTAPLPAAIADASKYVDAAIKYQEQAAANLEASANGNTTYLINSASTALNRADLSLQLVANAIVKAVDPTAVNPGGGELMMLFMEDLANEGTATPSLVSQPSVTSSDTVNVRGGPGTTEVILGQLAPGQTVPVTGKNAEGTWWQIDFNGQSGWVFGELVVFSGDASAVTVVNVQATQPTAMPVVEQPTLTAVACVPVRVGATCTDGTTSNATGSGACSHHGGVAQWLVSTCP